MTVLKKIMGEEIVLIDTGEAIANRLKDLSVQKGHKNEGQLLIHVCHTGEINTKMIETILNNKTIEVRKCTI